MTEQDSSEDSEAKLAAAAEALFEVHKKLTDGAETIARFASSPRSAVLLAAEMVKCLAMGRDLQRAEATRTRRESERSS